MKNQSTESKERTVINRAIQLIKAQSPISRHKLNFQLNITTKYYERLHPFIADVFENVVEYDKLTKLWRYIESDDVSKHPS